MADNLYGEAASLFQGAAQTATAEAQMGEQRNKAGLALAESAGTNATHLQGIKMSQAGETQRQNQAGAQGIASLIAQAKAKAQQEQEKYMRETTEISPEAADGLVKSAGNPALSTLAGKRVDTNTLLGTFSASLKAKYKKPTKATVDLGNGPVEVLVSMHEDENGNTVPEILTIGKSVPKPASGSGGGGAGGKKDTSEGWFRKASDAQKLLLSTFTKKGGMPKSGKTHEILSFFTGGDKANDAKIANFKQVYSDYQTAASNYNTLAEKEGKSPLSIDPDVEKAMNAILTLKSGSQGVAGGDQKVVDWFKAKYKKDPTPEDIAWAKGKMNG